MKYNYIILGSQWDIYKYAFNDIKDLDNAKYISFEVFLNFFKKNIFHKIHFSRTIGKYVNLPLKSIWNKYYFDFHFENSNPVCFVFYGAWGEINKLTNLSGFLRKRYPNCKLVYFHTDLYSLKRDWFDRPMKIEDDRRLYDLLLSYDLGDCEKYSMIYHPTVMSFINLPEKEEIDCDIYFIGKDKGRLPLLIKYCKWFQSKGLKCKFYILGVPKEKTVETQGIVYINKILPYLKVLEDVLKCNCVLELMQDNAQGYTYRVWEALLYKKVLITNNKSVFFSPFFKGDNMFYIEDNPNVLDGICEKISRKKYSSYDMRNEISPISLLYFIDKTLT